MNVNGSVALTPNNKLENRRAQMKEAPKPIASPAASKSAPLPEHQSKNITAGERLKPCVRRSRVCVD